MVENWLIQFGTDEIRLNVLRGLLAEVTNASKTPTPYTSDVQLLKLLKKRSEASKAAALEFESAEREDLKNKELAQVAVLEEYASASSVKSLSEDEMAFAIQSVIEKRRNEGQPLNLGSVMKDLMQPGGAFNGTAVDGKEVSNLIKNLI